MGYTPRNLKLWTRPDCYIGATYPDYYRTGFGRSRDSDLLEESNFQSVKRILETIEPPKDWPHEEPPIAITSASHWAVGWVESILVHKDFEAALKEADAIVEACEGYPVVDEADLSERECERVWSEWENMRIEDRARLCAKNGVSIFAARRDTVPDCDGIWEYLRSDS